jgi:hypothetical protein
MKRKIIAIIIFTQLVVFSSIAQQSWTTTYNVSPTYGFLIPDYSFSTPFPPAIKDTMNIKFFYYYPPDSIFGLQVFEQRNTQFDSTQTDTLGFIVSSLLGSINSTLLNSQAIPVSNGFKGIEINIRYNDLVNGKVLVSYFRLYYKKDLMLTFTASGYQNNLSEIVSNKILFFNSISFTPVGY